MRRFFIVQMSAPVRKNFPIFTKADGCYDILLPGEKTVQMTPNHNAYYRQYDQKTISDIFRIMGCHMPLNDSMSDWIFSFLKNAPDELGSELLNLRNEKNSLSSWRSKGYIILSRIQFHRLVCASLFVHQFRKVRYSVDFRLALDFHEERRFLIILLSGAPGTGKSTIASLIASRLSVNHIISTDSIRHAMRTSYPKNQYPVLHCSTYECGNIVDPDHHLSEEERCLIGYNAQSDLVGKELMKVVKSFVDSRTSLIVEGVHLSINILMKIVETFPNVIPFLIFIKKEDFHRQRFAVRAKYMTTDPSQNRYISNFESIRSVQTSLSKGASEHLIPKIDNRNIDRSLETMHQTIFSYLKKQDGMASMYDPQSKKLTLLDEIWKLRKKKLTPKAKTLKQINTLKQGSTETSTPSPPDQLIAELKKFLPTEGSNIQDDVGNNNLIITKHGTMMMTHNDALHIVDAEVPPLSHDKESDPTEVTLTDFFETTDSEAFPDTMHHQF